MDNLTHGLTGALMGQMGLKKTTGLGLAALVLGANLPDIDVVGLLWLDSKEALGFRRGITHGPIGVVLLPAVLAALLWGFDRWQESRGKRPQGRDPVSLKWLYILGLIGAISHTLMDWLNVYGVRFLYPFKSQWYYGDTLFIIDVWLWALLALSVWWSARGEKRGQNWRLRGAGGFIAGCVFVAANWWITQEALITYSINTKVAPTAENGLSPKPDIPTDLKIAAPVPFWPLQREIILGRKNEYYAIAPGAVPSPWDASALTNARCAMPDLSVPRQTNSQLDGFLTWSRAPFAERAGDGSVILRDARFYDPLARDRFSLALPEVQCVPIDGEPGAD